MSRPKEFGINELAKNILRKKDGRELSEEEVDAFLRESNNILSDMEPDLGLDKENPFAEDINNYQNVIRYLEYHGVTTDSAKRFFTAYNETVRNRDWTGVYNKPDSIAVIWDLKESKLVDLRPPIPVYNPFDTRIYQEGQIIGGGGASGGQKAEGNNNPLETGTSQNHSVGSPTEGSSKENTTFSTAHEVLDLAGYVPGFGSAAGAAETVLYLAEGNYSAAILSAATIIPGAKYVKAAKKLADVPGVSRLIRTEKNVPVRLPAGKPASSSIPLEDLGRIKPGSKDIYMPDGKSLRPNIQYKAGEFEYLYKTDEAGRLSQFKTDNLQLTERDKRLRHNPNTPGKQEGDQAAHLAADRFGGSPELANLVSQSSHVNLSEYKKLENEWAKAIKEGKNVQVEVNVIYEGANKRPSEFVVSHTIDGKTTTTIIAN